MAEAMIKGMTSQGMKEILVSEPQEERRQYLESQYNVSTTADNNEIASACRIVILAVKPQNMDAVADEIKGTITEDNTVVSIAAGITLAYLTSKFNTKKIILINRFISRDIT